MLHIRRFLTFTYAHLPLQVGLGPGAPRLLVNYLNESINALDLIPPILQQYVTNLLIGSSNIQVLDFVTESVLQEALQYLESEPSEWSSA